MSVRMRLNRSQTRSRRSHHGLKEPRLSACEQCGENKIRHQVCDACGTYRGRQVLDVASRDARKEARRKAKLKAMGQPTGGSDTKKEEQAQDDQSLDPQALSDKKK